MSKSLSRLLRREQFAFLARDRSVWREHLDKTRAFMGEGLQAADPSRPVLILGAGSGLEVPWALAPPRTTGWDADPWSRLWTAARHRRFPLWVFEDLTGGLDDLERTARRAIAEPWSGHRRDAETAAKRLAGLLPFLRPNPEALRAWIAAHRPGTILAANVMGQFGAVAERVVEAAFGLAPWDPDPERRDPLMEAMEAWTRRAVLGFLAALQESGADLWLVHDRAVVFNDGPLQLSPWKDGWTDQVAAAGGAIEASDALAGVDVPAALAGSGRVPVRKERWLWPVAAGQRHLIEALAFCRKE
ncbi:MAG: hypothetical protein HY014_16880 [Acidobacteria bacterium]|nr:hypothetical protein [Acidobacteriota bacterium]MBI3489807.1 hypothetical protein [Acidobacteriota bacterium]